MKFSGRITLTNVADGKDAVSYDIEFRLVRGEDSQALSALNLSATDLKDASVQAMFYRNGEAYDAPKARMWTVDKAGAVLGIPAELSGSAGSVADAGLLYIGEETAYVVCRMLDADGSVLCERSLPVLLNGADGEDGKSVTVTGDVARYAQTETPARPDDSAFAEAMPEPVQGMFMWTMRTVAYSDGKESKSYSVSRIGSDGEGGSTTHFAYATSADGSQGFSTTAFDGAAYIGSYTDQKLADSTNYKDYTWMRWQGAKGDKGETGVGISSITEYYLASASSSGVTTSTSGWTTSIQTVTASKRYLWNYERVTYTDGTSETSLPVIIGTYGDKGATGVGISSITEYYLASASVTGVTRSTSGWTTSVQTVTATKKYLWNYEKITYTDGSVVYTDPVVIGAYGDKGDKGDKGESVTISGTETAYQLGTSGTETPAGEWLANVPALTDAKPFLWTRSTVTYSDGTKAVSYSVSYKGADGRSVSSIKEQYYLSTSSSELAGGSWADAPQPWEDGKYYWTRSVIAYSDGASAPTSPVCVSGGQGASGNDGRGVASVDVEYYQSDSPTQLTGGSWQTEPPAWASGKYVWQRTKTTYTDGSGAYTEPVCLTGEKGSDGQKGKDGLSYAPNLVTGGKSFRTNYYKSFTLLNLKSGQKIAVAAESVTGSIAEHKAVFYDGKGETMSDTIILNEGNGYSGVLTITTPNVYAANLRIYAGTDGKVQSSYVQFTGLVVVAGGTPAKPWRPSAEEMKGDKGDPGDKGDSVTIADKSVKYAASASGTTVPGDGEWQAGIPSLTDAKPFMWTRVVITYNGANGSTTSYSVAYKGRNGADGNDGTSVTITGKSVLYAISSSGTAAPSTGWQAGVPEATRDKPFVWTRTTVSYSDGTTTVAYSVGRIGSDGKGISATKTMFGASSSPETQPASWSETEPELGEGEYLWTKEVTTYTDGTTSEAVPVVSLDYLSRVIRKGKSALMGGLVLGNILAAADANGDVRSFLSGLLSLPALGLGVSDFGLDAYKAVTELNHDGTGHLGRLFLEKGPYNGTADSMVLKDWENVARVFFTYASLIPLSTLLSQSSGTKSAGSFSFSVTAQAGEEGSAYASGKDLSVPYDGSLLDVEGTITVPATDVLTPLNVFLVDLTEGNSINIKSHLGFDAETVPFSFELSNAKGHTWRIEARYYNVRGSVSRTATVSVTEFSCVYSSDQRRVGIGRNGFQAFLNSIRYFQVDDNGDATVKTDSVQSKTVMADKLTVNGGAGFGVLWMGKVNENGGIYASFGPLRTKGKGGATKSGSDYTITFPGGSSTAGTEYAVFCQPEKDTSDGRYATVYGKTSSSFKVATRWGDSQRDAAFYFMVVSMMDWY